MTALKYGNRNVPKMIREFDAHRQACRAEGTPRIQETLDAIEDHIGFAYQHPDPATIAKSDDFVALPRADAERLYDAMKAAMQHVGEDQWSEPWFFNATLAITVLKERMK